MDRTKSHRLKDMLQTLRNALREKFNLIEYTKNFAKKKATKGFKYPEFNNRHYSQDELEGIFKKAVECCKDLANDEGMGNTKIMRLRINEIAGNLYNIVAALGNDNPKNS